MRAAVEKIGNGVEIEYMSGLPAADVLRKVAALPSGTVVFTPGYFVDGAGAVSTPRQSVERIAAASAAPVYGAFDTLIGAGIVGGYMTRFEDQGKNAGAIVVRLLEGAVPAQIASAFVARVPMVDWRQVRRWGIDERRMPADTIVRFREPTAWDRHWREISAAVAILLLQAGLITALLFERRLRRRTAAALEESEKQMTLAAHAARLSMWIWDVTRDKVWATATLRQQAGPPKDPPIGFDQVLESAHPADRERARPRRAASAVATNEELDVEYRMLGPDGELRWIAARGRAEKSGSERLTGVRWTSPSERRAELQAEKDRAALTAHDARVDDGAAFRFDCAPAQPAAGGDSRQCRGGAQNARQGAPRSRRAEGNLRRHRDRRTTVPRRSSVVWARCTSAAR